MNVGETLALQSVRFINIGTVAMRLISDRRALLAVAGAALGLGLLPRSARASPAIPPAPVARVEVVKDTYFGETLSDPFRWMENDKDPDWLPFLKGQNAHTRAILDALPGRKALATRIAELSGEAAATRSAQRAGGRLFFEQRPVGADNFRLYLREAGADRVLIDPVAMSGDTGHVSLDWWRASPDGAHVVYGLSRDGSEDSVLHILDVAGDRGLPETIPNTQGGRPQWLDDGSGFFYKQLTGAVGTPERFLDAQARFHRLGSDPAADPLAIGGRSAGGITVGRAMTERPDLFAAVIDGVGWSNPLRYVAEQNAYGEEAEWGAIADEAGYHYLKTIDSYQAVKDGVAYPAVLLTTGITDPRVAPFHVGKMTARLQAASASGAPVLLRVDFDAGHGIGSTRAQQDREATDTYVFLIWRTGGKGRIPA
jgi:protease II